MTRDPLQWLRPDLEPATNFDVPKAEFPRGQPTVPRRKPIPDSLTPSSKQASTKEARVHVYLELPESLKDEVDDLFHFNKDLRRKGKNNWLIECVREGLRSEAQANMVRKRNNES